MKIRTSMMVLTLITLHFSAVSNAGQNSEIPVKPVSSHNFVSGPVCQVSDSLDGSPVSVLSQSKSTGVPMGWLSYNGPATQTLKFLMRFPSFSAFDKQVNKMSFPAPGATSAQIPLTYNWFSTDPSTSGPAIVKIKGTAGSCSYPLELVDHGFESIDVPKQIFESTNASGVVAKNIGTITRVRVAIWISGAFDAAISFALIGPDGTAVQLSDFRGGTGSNFGSGFYFDQRTVFDDQASTPIGSGSDPFVGAYVPEQPLSAFAGKFGNAANGLWRLSVFSYFFGGTVVNWALIIDDTTASKVTWSNRLDETAFEAAGYTPTATEIGKLNSTTYSVGSILTGTTDRLVDSSKCSDCHTGSNSQGPGRYYPIYTDMNSGSMHYIDNTFSTYYSWNDPTTNGLVYHFQNAGIPKPDGLKKIFQKWLDDGALP
ncbi:MAG: hypothetical protein C5B54_11030 [Acidobacteria bacterium]|nr:MAG: hypothetical protein C5B54_11030 [Acidobacteriota bacterium]